MNDFTKEELKIMYCNLCMNPRTEEILIKIQSMIENYCEHDFDMTDWINDSSGCRWYKCKKCQGHYR